MHNAHPPRVRWHVETYDPTAAEWSSGLPLLDRQAAIAKLARLTEHYPKWADGTACQRRLVLETTTFEDLSADVSHLARFPKSGFVITGVGGQDFAAIPDRTPDGRPAIRLCTGSSETGHAEATVPLDQLEEVIAGVRDMARQAGRLRVHLGDQDVTEHVVNPAAALAGAPLTPEQLAGVAAILPTGTCITADAIRQASEPTPEPPRVVVHIDNTPRVEEIIRHIVRRGPGEAGLTQ